MLPSVGLRAPVAAPASDKGAAFIWTPAESHASICSRQSTETTRRLAMTTCLECSATSEQHTSVRTRRQQRSMGSTHLTVRGTTMRFLLKVTIPVESGNAAAKAGKLGTTIQSILGGLKPEAVYFTDNNGQRAGFIFLEMQEASQIP